MPLVPVDVDLSGADGVSFAEVERIDAELPRDEVDVRLGGERVLRLARRAIVPGR